MFHPDNLSRRPEAQGESCEVNAASRHAVRVGFTLSGIQTHTKIDRWFLVQIKEIVDFEEELAGAKN